MRKIEVPECYHPSRFEDPTLREDLIWAAQLDTAMRACNRMINATQGNTEK